MRTGTGPGMGNPRANFPVARVKNFSLGRRCRSIHHRLDTQPKQKWEIITVDPDRSFPIRGNLKGSLRRVTNC
jgi:hypothetical protein